MTNEQRDKTKYSQKMLWISFLGVPWLCGAIVVCSANPITRAVGEKALPYVILGVPGAVFVLCMALFGRVKERILIYVGVTCWILTFVIFFGYFWFGAGSFGHH